MDQMTPMIGGHKGLATSTVDVFFRPFSQPLCTLQHRWSLDFALQRPLVFLARLFSQSNVRRLYTKHAVEIQRAGRWVFDRFVVRASDAVFLLASLFTSSCTFPYSLKIVVQNDLHTCRYFWPRRSQSYTLL